MKWNHNRPLSDFQDSIRKLQSGGFNPIFVTQLYIEEAFAFETEEEARRAYRTFERDASGKEIGEISAWWYGKEAFLREVEEYERKGEGVKVLIHPIPIKVR